MTRRRGRCVTSVEQAEQLAADVDITVQDLDEVHRFAAFLEAAAGKTEAERAQLYLEHYPQEDQ